MSTTKTTYEVKRGFYLNQQFIAAAPVVALVWGIANVIAWLTGNG